MSRAVLGLGSNLGDRLGFLRLAVEGLGPAVRQVSPVYETAPWGVTEQDDFLNAVVIVDDPTVDARGWLHRGLELEEAAGRRREQRWGPRTLDVDVITVDDVRCADPRLTLPHPGAADRPTVLLPWSDIDPAATLPGVGPVRELLAGLTTEGCVRRDDLILRPSAAWRPDVRS